MPRYDKTGPQGKGPLTGRGLGECDGVKDCDFSEYGLGRRKGGRFFLRRNRGRIFSEDISLFDEIKALKEKISNLESQLKTNDK